MPDRDRQHPNLSEDGLHRRSLQERRLADQLRQNLLRRKLQQRARNTSDPTPADRAPGPDSGED